MKKRSYIIKNLRLPNELARRLTTLSETRVPKMSQHLLMLQAIQIFLDQQENKGDRAGTERTGPSA